MRTLLLEPSGDFSGDMIVGLLCDLGVQPSTFEWELAKVSLGAFHLHFERQPNGERRGVHFGIHMGAVHTHDQDADAGEFEAAQVHTHADDAHEHDHEHGHEEDCRSATDLRANIADSELSDPVRQRALAVFDHFIGAEAETAHADAPSLAFDHEGGLAACAQIVCVCIGMVELGAEQIQTSQMTTEPMAAAILAGYRGAQDLEPSGMVGANAGCGIGRSGSLRGSLQDAA